MATGARANYLGLPSEDKFKNRGVSACAVCDGALPRFRNKPLAVVGGGDSAVEEASYLSKFASTVYLIHRRQQLRASKIMQTRLLENHKIKPQWNRTVDEVLGDDKNGVMAVRLKSTLGGETETLEVSGMFLGIGHTPNTDSSPASWSWNRTVTSAGRRRRGPIRAWTAYSRPAMWRTAIIARQSRPRAPAAWRRWTRNAGWSNTA